MWKKTLTLAMACGLLFSQAAFAAEPEAGAVTKGLSPRLERAVEMVGKGMPHLPRARTEQSTKPFGLRELEELQQSDPEALKSKLLEAHTEMVARAQEIVDHKDTLAQEIIDRTVEHQAKALEQATKTASEATDQELAQKRLAVLKARQELMLASVTKNAQQMAGEILAHAEQVLANASSVRTRIENGEGLEVAKEWRQERTPKFRGRHFQNTTDQEN